MREKSWNKAAYIVITASCLSLGVAAGGDPPTGSPGVPAGREAAQADGADIRGPLGPVDYPGAGMKWAIALVAFTAVAGGLGLAVAFGRRRLRRPGAACEGAAPCATVSEGISADLEAVAFYASLMAAAREWLARRGESAAQSLTPRELADRLPAASARADPREWAGLCARAERALYGAEDVPPETRQADLEVMRRLLEETRHGL